MSSLGDAELAAREVLNRVANRVALAAALDPIVTIDSLGIVQSASDSVQRVLGWSPAALIGQNINVLMPEPHRSAHDGYLRHYLTTGTTNIMNRPRRFEALRRDGTLIPIELCVTRADVPGQAAPLFVGIIRNLAERRDSLRADELAEFQVYELLAEQTSALQTAHIQLRMSDRMASIGSLAAGLGHDMNNVLLPVRARLNALRAEGLSQSAKHHVDGIVKSIAYLQQLADGLHFLAMDPEVETADVDETDLCAWWQQTGALLSKAVPKHVRVEASIPADLPLVCVAAHALTQAILNLVVNAGEAIPAQLSAGRVDITARMLDDDNIELSVSDNGVGMSPETKRRAFELFFTTKPRGLGTGLGLALVRKVLYRAGGSVDVESEEGRGTTVRLRLPTVQELDDPARCKAMISLRDGRAAALVRHVLELSGANVATGDDPSDADVWVIEPGATTLQAAQSWRSLHHDGRLVLFGAATERADEWQKLRPITIERPDDFNAVRAAIGQSLQG
ncbi:MAG: ATP-binding protein [Phycisphaerae bacterium]|nr:ATP-binding protein [Phycisphaerae bacterium]